MKWDGFTIILMMTIMTMMVAMMMTMMMTMMTIMAMMMADYPIHVGRPGLGRLTVEPFGPRRDDTRLVDGNIFVLVMTEIMTMIMEVMIVIVLTAIIIIKGFFPAG